MTGFREGPVTLGPGDALIIVDVQNDFLPGGTLAVPEGDDVVEVLNRYIGEFAAGGLPIFATRDWHPEDHCSFAAQGGPWPRHCVRGTQGAEFAPGLRLPAGVTIVSKADSPRDDSYSAFQETDLADRLRQARIGRLFIGGLATDYCVLQTVRDALHHGFEVLLLTDAIRAVNAKPEDGAAAEAEMLRRGARPVHLELIAP